MFRGCFSLERASFVPGPKMGAAHGYCSAVALPDNRETLVISGLGQGGSTKTTVVLDLGTMFFTTGPARDGDSSQRVCESGPTRRLSRTRRRWLRRRLPFLD